MMTNLEKTKKLKISVFAVKVGLTIFLILLLINGVVLYTVNFYSRAQQACMTTQQITADNRCLYILNGKIYSIGTRSAPHRGHPCGMDVTSIIPGFHQSSAALYLTPNYVADVCTAAPPTSTPTPTIIPTPTVTPVSTPTSMPTLTSTPIPTPRLTATPTPIPTSTPVPSPTQIVKISPTNLPTPTITPLPNATLLNFNLFLHGIGKAGDAANPSSAGNDPVNKQRNITVEIFNNANISILTLSGTVVYNQNAGNFTGSIPVNTVLQNSPYTMKIKVPQYLPLRVPNQITITNGVVNQVPVSSLYTGDVNNDDVLSILDYNLIMDCFTDILPPKSCSDPIKRATYDLNDDGSVNQIDYNLFLRELANIPGNH